MIPDILDLCPTEPEIFNGYLDRDGCPDELSNQNKSNLIDSDGDGIIDILDDCPNDREDIDQYDDDGCPEDKDGIRY